MNVYPVLKSSATILVLSPKALAMEEAPEFPIALPPILNVVSDTQADAEQTPAFLNQARYVLCSCLRNITPS